METTHKSLIAIKLLHTLIWAVMAGATLYVLYSGCFNQITRYTWIAILLILFEGLVLLLFRWTCPLTLVARRYSDSQKDNFDIYLPNWLARYNKQIFTSIDLLGLVLVLVRVLGARG
ncbi:MAG: hypothetical protein IT260_08205 [Saprospiraceae bacterium]|nr:hypothetical protein [Saprospiraceae bacterium]